MRRKMNIPSQSNQSQSVQGIDLPQLDISSLDTQKMVASVRPLINDDANGGFKRERHRHIPQAKRRKPRRLFLFALIFLLVCVIGSGVSVVGYQTFNAQYHGDLAQAQVGVKHLQTALSLMQGLSKNPLDAPTVARAQQEFAGASAVFTRLNTDLGSLPSVGTLLPVYGVRLSAALHLVPLAVEVSQAGMVGCAALNLIIGRFHNPLSAGSGLTMADLAAITKDLHQLEAILTQATAQVNALQPSDLKLDPRVGKAVTDFHKYLPTVQASLGAVDQLLPVLPALLGIGTPTNYLLELLDSTELRPTGGFIGNYGFATLLGGRLSNAHITDVYLFDDPFIGAGHTIPYPTEYKWFDIGPKSWSLHDSNLDADFPTSARNAEQNYTLEGGKVPIQGVIAITPTLIEQAIAVTGPISVPEYHETVTAQNLIDRIHYYELGPGRQGGNVPSPDGHSSVNKRFTELLGEHFLARVHQLPPSTLPKLLQVLISSLHTKDLQIYFNSPSAEKLLQLLHLDAAIQSPTGDGLFVVDANIGVDKANQYLTNTLNDQVAIDATGNAVHHTTITYAWKNNGPIYGSPLYRDYARVYVPPGSTLQAQQGWQSRGTSEAFGREVWAGFFTLTYGQTRTITLTWTEKGVVQKDAASWHYQYLLQRQAGAKWNVNVQVMLPTCAVGTSVTGGQLSHSRQTAMLSQSLNEDTTLNISYRC